jgi:tetratricopeptide (TPR) repeat protein
LEKHLWCGSFNPPSEAAILLGGTARYAMGLRSACSRALSVLILCQLAWAQHSTPQQLFQSAIGAQQRGDQALAVRDYQELLRLRPDMIAARAGLAAALISLGRLDDAIAQYRVALQNAPGNRNLELALALTYIKDGKPDEAATQLASLHNSQPDDARVATLLGDCDVRLGRNADAVGLLAPLERANPDNLYLEWVLGSALIRVGQIYEGTERAETVGEKMHSAEAYIAAAEANLSIRRFEQARHDLEAARRLNPQLADFDMLDGTIAESEGDLTRAAAIFQKVLAANPKEFQAHLHLGTILYTERQLDAARLHLRRVIEINPTSSSARYQLARVERAQGQLGAAVRDLEQVERRNPDWLPPHLELSVLYYRLNRPQDGARERGIVDRLRAAEQQRESKRRTVIPQLPSP